MVVKGQTSICPNEKYALHCWPPWDLFCMNLCWYMCFWNRFLQEETCPEKETGVRGQER